MTARRSSGAGAADGICRFAYPGYLNLVRTGLAPSAVGAPDQLTNLDQVPVGIAHVTADLAATVDRRGQKLRSAGALPSAYSFVALDGWPAGLRKRSSAGMMRSWASSWR